MGTPIGQLVVELSLDSSKFNQGITKAKRNLKTYSQDTRNAMRHARNNNYTLGDTNRALNNLATTYHAYGTAVASADKQLREWQGTEEEGSVQYEHLELERARMVQSMVDLDKQFKDFRLEAMKGNDTIYKFAEGAERLGVGMENTGRRVSEVGKFISQAGAVATAGGALFVKQAMDYEQGLKGIQRVSKSSDSEMRQLSTTLRGLATSMNVTHDETLQIAESAARLGIAQQDIGDFTRVIAMMGATTDMSVDQASNSIARFTSITGSGVEGAERLGSTLVHLGSEFATTESEIMQSAMLMVGTLSSLGAKEPEILGIATAMGALGISAERGGGSISKFFSELEVASIEGGEAIAGFAQVADMEIDKFSETVQNKPVKAFEAFINGLAQIQKEGGSVVEVLDDLGISETRMRDTIMRLAGGHEVLAEALSESNKEYGRGTALQEQYATMMESTSAQWEVLKNQLKDVAIDMGSSLLPAVQNMIKGADPLIEKVKGMAEGFSNLSPKMQENIVKWGAMSVAVGAGVNTAGKLITSGGSIITMFGTLTKYLRGLQLASQNDALGGIAEGANLLASSGGKATTELGKMAGATATASGAVTQLGTTSTGVLGAGGALTLGAVVTAGAIAYFGKKAYDTHKDLKLIESAKVDWGMVTPTADDVRQVEDLSDKFSRVQEEFKRGLTTSGIERATEAFKELGGVIDDIIDKKLDELDTTFENMSPQARAMAEGQYEGRKEELVEYKNENERIMAEVTDLTNTVYDKNGEIVEAQSRKLQRRMYRGAQIGAQVMGDGAAESVDIVQQMYADIDEMNDTQLKTLFKNTHGMLKHTQEQFEADIKGFRELYGDDEAGYQQAVQIREQEHQGEMSRIRARALQANLRSQAKMHAEGLGMTEEQFIQNEEQVQRFAEQMSQRWEALFGESLPVDKIKELLGMTFDATELFHKESIDNINNIFDEATNASIDRWNDFTDDININHEHLGTTMMERLKALSDAGDLTHAMWDELVFAKKNVPLDSNVREEMTELMLYHNAWETMSFEEKTAVLDIPQEAIDSMERAIDTIGVEWNDLEPKVMELIANGQSAETAFMRAMGDAGEWDALTPDNKQIIADSIIANEAISEALAKGDLWNDEEFVDQFLNAFFEDDVTGALATLMEEWGIVESAEDAEFGVSVPDAGTVEADLQNLFKVHTQLGKAEEIFFEMSTNGEEIVGDMESVKKVVGELKDVADEGGEFNLKTNSTTVVPEIDKTEKAISKTQDTADEGGDFDLDTNASEKTEEIAGLETQITDTQKTSAEGGDYEQRDNAPSAIARLGGIIAKILSIPASRTFTMFIEEARLATGTPYHQGGPAILGDGGRREPFLTPSGYFGVSPDEDTPYLLPRGTQVWPSISNFKADAGRSARLRDYLNQLPHYAQGTRRSFLDDLRTIEAPKIEMGDQDSEQVGDTYHITLDLNVVGSSLTRDQADNIIEPLIESAERLGRRKGARVNLGNM